MRDKDAKRLNKLVKKAGSALGERPDSLESVVERCTQNKMQAIMDNVSHPLHRILADQKSGRRNLFRSVTCKNKPFKNTFVPTAIRLFNSTASRHRLMNWTTKTIFSFLVIYGSTCNIQ